VVTKRVQNCTGNHGELQVRCCQGDQIGRIFAFWVTNSYYCATYFRDKSYALILTKTSWATFWVIFSQTHQVTLVTVNTLLMAIILQVFGNSFTNFLLFLCRGHGKGADHELCVTEQSEKWLDS
jgi:hypothetical protein